MLRSGSATSLRLRAPMVSARWDSDVQVLGFALGHLERSGRDDYLLLKEICVRTSAQRKGHGTRLLEALTQRLSHVQHWYLLTARTVSRQPFTRGTAFAPLDVWGSSSARAQAGTPLARRLRTESVEVMDVAQILLVAVRRRTPA